MLLPQRKFIENPLPMLQTTIAVKKMCIRDSHCINVMEIRHTISPEMELIDDVDYNDMDSMLSLIHI